MSVLQLRRWWWRWHVTEPHMQALLRQPLPSTSRPFQQRRFVALDLETTSLDPKTGEIVSVAWVVIEQGRIHLDQARHFHLTPEQGVGQSAVFHQLTDTTLEAGIRFDALVPELLAAVAGSTLIFHHAELDMGFLNRYLRHTCGAPLLLPIADTLRLEYRRLHRRKTALEPGDLRLGTCRARYHLPALPAHDALSDAIATAELFLAQQAQ